MPIMGYFGVLFEALSRNMLLPVPCHALERFRRYKQLSANDDFSLPGNDNLSGD